VFPVDDDDSLRRGGDMRIIAFIVDTAIVRDILAHLGEPTAPPRSRPHAALHYGRRAGRRGLDILPGLKSPEDSYCAQPIVSASAGSRFTGGMGQKSST
jgi:hypothetical protein